MEKRDFSSALCLCASVSIFEGGIIRLCSTGGVTLTASVRPMVNRTDNELFQGTLQLRNVRLSLADSSSQSSSYVLLAGHVGVTDVVVVVVECGT